jgi:hypothetical protein
MRRFFLMFATFSFVLCGVIDAAHADFCDVENDASAVVFSVDGDTGDNKSTDDDTMSGHASVHHHHHATVNNLGDQSHRSDDSRFALSADLAKSSLVGHISKPPRS